MDYIYPRTTETDYVAFVMDVGCASEVSRQGGLQFISLSSACSTRNIIHEIGHTIGLWYANGRELRFKHSGKCADVEAASTLSGARVNQYTCHGGANQRWTLQAL